MKTWHVVFKTTSGTPGNVADIALKAVSWIQKSGKYVFVDSEGKEVGWFDATIVIGIYFVE